MKNTFPKKPVVWSQNVVIGEFEREVKYLGYDEWDFGVLRWEESGQEVVEADATGFYLPDENEFIQKAISQEKAAAEDF